MTTRLRTPLGDHDHVFGPPDAPVTLVEYGDYECPHCRRAHPIVASVLRQLGRPVRFAYRHFPGRWKTKISLNTRPNSASSPAGPLQR
jgi:protein-disulfide isomerase